MSVLRKPGVVALTLLAVGLPVNSLSAYALLGVATLIVLTGRVTTSATRWLAAVALALFVLAIHALLPAPRIEEGHNAFLVEKPGGALERGLPQDAFRQMAEQFAAAYPPEKRCREGAYGCWGVAGLKDQTFAFAADGVWDKPAYSRRVTGIDFDDPIWLRLGFVNDSTVNFIGRDGELQRLQRDRRSLAIFGRWRLMLPWFVMVRFPPEFAGAKLCWRGEVLWEGANEQFARLDNKEFGCRMLAADDIGRRIFGVSIGPDAALAMSLDAPFGVKARRALEAAATAIGVVGILLLLVARWRPRSTVLSLQLIGCALLVIVLIDATFIGGFRPLDGADDGLAFSGFAREMLYHLAHGNLAGALRGGEDVFFFTPGMRYVRMLEFLVFGDTFLGYLAVMLALPFIVYAVAKRFLGIDWALVFVIAFVVTPLGVLFGTSYLQYIVWAARGFADPFAAACFLGAIALLAGRAAPSFDDRAAPAFWGALLMAIAVLVRPNLAPGVGIVLGGVGLAALLSHHVPRLIALCVGFLPIFLTLWHNWHFGGVLIPFSDNMTSSFIYAMAPADYLSALGELVRLDFGGATATRAARQIIGWFAGPSEFWAAAPLHVLGTALLIRVACAKRFEPMLRLVALATLGLSLLGFIYVLYPRYHLLTWLLMAIVSAAWLQREGLALFDHRWPGTRERLARNTAIMRIGHAIARLKRNGELGTPA